MKKGGCIEGLCALKKIYVHFPSLFCDILNEDSARLNVAIERSKVEHSRTALCVYASDL
jgi:hypothetical protein